MSGVAARLRHARIRDIANRPDLERKRQLNKVEQALRKIGLDLMKLGIHPQEWRVDAVTGARKKVTGFGATLGPMGSLGDDVILEILLNTGIITQLRSLKIDISVGKLEAIIRSELMNPLLHYLRQKINVWAPLRTGALRTSLLNSLISSTTSSFPFRLVLKTQGIAYAGPVNKMPQMWLRRSGTTPQARKGWYNLLLLNGRNKAKKLLSAMVKHVATLLPKPIIKLYFPRRTSWNLARALFRVSLR